MMLHKWSLTKEWRKEVKEWALLSALHEARVYSIFFMEFEGSFYNMFTFYNFSCKKCTSYKYSFTTIHDVCRCYNSVLWLRYIFEILRLLFVYIILLQGEMDYIVVALVLCFKFSKSI